MAATMLFFDKHKAIIIIYYHLHHCKIYLHQCGPQKGQGEIRCEIQGGGQEMAVMVGYNDKNFNYSNSGEFVLPPPLGFSTKFT